MPVYQLLTDRTLAQSSAITPTTLIHIVTTGDTTQNPAGSSYKAELGQLSNLFNFSGGSGNCITDLYVSNIHSCSPLNINPLDEGEVYFGSTSGVTIDVTNSRLGIGTTTPTENLHIVSTSSARIRIEADTDDISETDNAEILFTQDGGNTRANISLTPDTNNDLMIGVNAGAGTTPDIRFNTRSDGTSFTTSADTKVIIKNDGKVGIGVNEPQYFLQVFSGNSQLYYDPTSIGGRLLLSGSTNLPRIDVGISPYLLKPGAGIGIGIRAWNDTSYPGYGKVGDGHVYVGSAANGLNLISVQGTGTEDYIRFYAGQEALPANTPDIHIQGTGTTRGYVGINNFNPTANLHVSGSTLVSGSLSATTLNLTANNNLNTSNNTLRFTDTDAGASANQFSGKIEFYSSDISGIGVKSYIGGIVSSTSSEGSIIFGTTGQTGSLAGGTTVGERMRITSDGYVGIGQTSPLYTLDVSSGVEVADEIALRVANDGNKGVYFAPTANSSSFNQNTISGDTVIVGSPGESLVIGSNTGFAGLRFSGGSGALAMTSTGWLGLGSQYLNPVEQPSQQLDVEGNARFRAIGSVASAGALHYTSNGTLTTNTSDIRLKENIEPLTNSLEKILQLTGVTYNWIGETGKRIGMIAQDVEKVIPELVFTNNNTEEKIKGIHQDNLTAVLVEAIKEQQKIIEELKVRISNLES